MNQEVEYIDLVNADGEIVERKFPRNNKIPSGLYMRIIIAVITNAEGNFLAHKRAASKSHGGLYDHVCGGVKAGEDPIKQTVPREAVEEVTITPRDVQLVRKGVNEYGRYCMLVWAQTSDTIDLENLDAAEVETAGFYSLNELQEKQESGEFEFVNGFFEDIAAVNAYRASYSEI